MIKFKKHVLVMALLLGSGVAHASYLMNCQLTGRVVDFDVRNVFRHDTSSPNPLRSWRAVGNAMHRLDLVVSAAKSSGRADADCHERFVGQTVHVEILDIRYSAWQKLKNGQILTVFYQEFNDREHPQNIQSFALSRRRLWFR